MPIIRYKTKTGQYPGNASCKDLDSNLFIEIYLSVYGTLLHRIRALGTKISILLQDEWNFKIGKPNLLKDSATVRLYYQSEHV